MASRGVRETIPHWRMPARGLRESILKWRMLARTLLTTSVANAYQLRCQHLPKKATPLGWPFGTLSLGEAYLAIEI